MLSRMTLTLGSINLDLSCFDLLISSGKMSPKSSTNWILRVPSKDFNSSLTGVFLLSEGHLSLSDLNLTVNLVQHSLVINLKVNNPIIMRLFDELWFFLECCEDVNSVILDELKWLDVYSSISLSNDFDDFDITFTIKVFNVVNFTLVEDISSNEKPLSRNLSSLILYLVILVDLLDRESNLIVVTVFVSETCVHFSSNLVIREYLLRLMRVNNLMRHHTFNCKSHWLLWISDLKTNWEPFLRRIIT